MIEPEIQKLVDAARAARDCSLSPFSNFCVGAAVETEDGKIYTGCNIESASYGLTCCAERVALFHWGANHPDDPIETIAITAHTNDFALLKPVTPCGSCLQVMAEYEKKQGKPIRIILYCQNGPVWVIKGIENLLPFLFFEERLA